MSKLCCHPERSEAKSRDLGTELTANENEARRSFDSLRSLRMTRILFFHGNDTLFNCLPHFLSFFPVSTIDSHYRIYAYTSKGRGKPCIVETAEEKPVTIRPIARFAE